MDRLTKGFREALEWFAGQSKPVHWFGDGTPTLTMARKLLKRGWLRTQVQGHAGMVGYEITPAGRQALQEDSHG